MEQGRIVEQGSHAELLAAQGAYYRLYQAQFAGEDAEERAEEALAGAVPVADPAAPAGDSDASTVQSEESAGQA